jgi:hypothetical protein
MPRSLLCLLFAGVVALTGCAPSFSSAYTTQTTTPPPDSSGAPVAGSETITIDGEGYVVHAGGPTDKPGWDASWVGVLDTLNRYLEAAVLTPLRSGGPAGDLAPLFTPLAATRVLAVGPDRAAFIDEGLPPATDLRRERGVAALTGLGGRDALLSVVSAQLELRLTGWIDGAPLTVVRAGELVLIPEGERWRIDAWDLRVTRTVAGVSTTTTVRT